MKRRRETGHDVDHSKRSRSSDIDTKNLSNEGSEKHLRPSFSLDRYIEDGAEEVPFQVVAVDYTVKPPRKGTTDPDNPRCAVIRVFGVTEEGYSVMTHIHGFLPYFYVKQHEELGDEMLQVFSKALGKAIMDSRGSILPVTRDNPEPRYILNMEIQMKKSLVGFNETDSPFIKITTALPAHVSTGRICLERGLSVGNLGHISFERTYESNIQFALRYMCDVGMVGGGWVSFPIHKAKVRSTYESESVCQIEADLHYEDLIVYPSEGEYLRIAPLRILSFDIECENLQNEFPTPERDRVIQIANLLTIQTGKADNTIVHNIFTYKSCSPIVDADVYSFENEGDMLMSWKNFFVSADPDIVTGYNITNFDIPYLLNRARTLKLKEFPFLGRVKGMMTRLKDTTFSSKAFGTRDSQEANMEGRIVFDVLQCISREYKLRSYTLNSVSSHFLGEQKEEVHYSMISTLQNGTEETRRRLAVYCLKDAYLPQRLLDKLMLLVNYIEMARVTGVPIDYLLSKGQQIKVLSQLYRYANNQGLLIPTMRVEPSEEKYEGATVIEPLKGFYNEPIATLDFSSLYPSIMITHNLCYSTLLKPSQALAMDEEAYFKTPRGDYFLRAEKKKGILPDILQNLLSARIKAKSDLKKEKDEFKRKVLNGRQLALKISANSVYGFTGATVGRLPCIEISASVTSIGRQMIELTSSLVSEKYDGSTIVYGDTDSVMVNFHVDTVEEAMALGREAAEYVTEHFSGTIRLEFEKVYYPYLLISKKRYAGLYWTNPEKFDRLDAKGIETVRRDNCELVRTVIEKCLNLILKERNVNAAISYAKRVISELLQNKVDISLLVISKQLSKGEDKYESKVPHVELAKRIRKRNPGAAPKTGDRVPYVIVEGHKGARFYEKSEDPIYALKNNIPLDTRYYLENQLQKPLVRIFKQILPDPSSLFEGEHTRKLHVATPTSGALSKFIVKRETCSGCRAPLSNAAKHVHPSCLCDACRPSADIIYAKRNQDLVEVEEIFSDIWTQCQECQKSLLDKVICSNADCPIFYRRQKVRKDLASAIHELKRFN